MYTMIGIRDDSTFHKQNHSDIVFAWPCITIQNKLNVSDVILSEWQNMDNLEVDSSQGGKRK